MRLLLHSYFVCIGSQRSFGGLLQMLSHYGINLLYVSRWLPNLYFFVCLSKCSELDPRKCAQFE